MSSVSFPLCSKSVIAGLAFAFTIPMVATVFSPLPDSVSTAEVALAGVSLIDVDHSSSQVSGYDSLVNVANVDQAFAALLNAGSDDFVVVTAYGNNAATLGTQQTNFYEGPGAGHVLVLVRDPNNKNGLLARVGLVNPTPTNVGEPGTANLTETVRLEYDPMVDSPTDPTNGLALLNAAVALGYSTKADYDTAPMDNIVVTNEGSTVDLLVLRDAPLNTAIESVLPQKLSDAYKAVLAPAVEIEVDSAYNRSQPGTTQVASLSQRIATNKQALAAVKEGLQDLKSQQHPTVTSTGNKVTPGQVVSKVGSNIKQASDNLNAALNKAVDNNKALSNKAATAIKKTNDKVNAAVKKATDKVTSAVKKALKKGDGS